MLETGKVSKIIWVLTTMAYAVLFLYPVIPYGAAITFALSGAVILLTILKTHGKGFPKFTMYHGYMVLFTAFCFLSAMWAWNAENAIEMGVSLLKTTFVIFLLFSYYLRYPDIDALLKAIVWGGYLACALIVLMYGPAKVLMLLLAGRRIDNSVMNANTIGLIAAVSAIVHLHFILRQKRVCWKDIFLLFAVVVVAVSGSKKALLFLVGGYFMLFAMKSLGSKHATRNLLITMGALTVITALMLMLPVFRNLRIRIYEMICGLLGKGHTNASTSLRLTYILVGLNQFLKTPLLGIGMDCSNMLLAAETGRSTYLHCNYVELMACGGLVGAAIYYSAYGYFLSCFWKHRKNRDENYAVLLTLTVLLLLTDFAIVSYYSKETFFYGFVLYIYTKSKMTGNGFH